MRLICGSESGLWHRTKHGEIRGRVLLPTSDMPIKTRIFALALLTVTLISCGFGLGATYRELEPMLKEDAAYSERLLNAEADSPDANLKEFDGFCDRSVELRTERLVVVSRPLPNG
jgi:hypothetical protein